MRRMVSSVAVAIALVGAFTVGLSLTHHGTPPAGADTVLAQVRATLRTSYYRPVPANVLAQPNVPALLRALNDPYTEYLDPTQFRLLRRETRSSYPGIGIGVLPVDNGLQVVRMKPGPAERAGVRVGDVIREVDGYATKGAPSDELVRRILGPKGSVVRLRLQRGTRIFERNVVREQIAAPAVHSRLLAARHVRVGYVKLTAFSLGAAPVLKLTLAKLRRANIAGIVLDLRGNPGGLFDQAVAVASLFLDRGVIVTIDSAHQKPHTYTASGHSAVRLPLVVLVDRDSASSAEIVAAALHDNRRAILLGEHTFGKGLIQELRPLPNGAALRLTTARYLTPSGRDINTRGVYPDLVAPDDPSTRVDETLQGALRLFLR